MLKSLAMLNSSLTRSPESASVVLIRSREFVSVVLKTVVSNPVKIRDFLPKSKTNIIQCNKKSDCFNKKNLN